MVESTLAPLLAASRRFSDPPEVDTHATVPSPEDVGIGVGVGCAGVPDSVRKEVMA